MISYIKGTLEAVEEDMIIVETGGIGYGIRVPLSLLEELPSLGSPVIVHTYFQVREDSMTLYGFLNRQDREMFKQLISVNGIGPRGALGILSVMRPGRPADGYCKRRRQGHFQGTRYRPQNGPEADFGFKG